MSESLLDRLEGILRTVGESAGKYGFTMADVRDEAERLGILSPDDKVSAIGALPKRLGCTPHGYRPSHRENQKGRILRVWHLPKTRLGSPYREG